MASTSFFDELLHSIAFPFKDSDWVKKLAIGFGLTLAISIVPIIPTLLIAGYCQRIMKQIIIEDGEPYLPEWVNWGAMLSEGLKLWGAGIIFVLPLFLLIFIALVFMLLAVAGPVFFIRSNGTIAPAGSIIFLAGIGLFIVMMSLVSLLSLAINLIQGPAIGHLVAKDSFSAAFRVGEWWPILKKGFGAFLTVIISTIVLFGLAFFAIQILSITIILIFLLPFLFLFLTFFINLYTYTFYALAYRYGRRKLSDAS